MKFAMVNGERQEPQKGTAGECVGCSHPMTAKCGEKRVHHWAHKTGKPCDHWWEPETVWHRDWKNKFPSGWLEKRHLFDNDEIHIADVKTEKDWVLEFQYSAISSDERSSRNAFYGKLVWVVNGLRLKRDPVQFFNSLKVAGTLENHFIRRVCDVVSEKTALIRDWSHASVPVFFDFSEREFLWCLLPQQTDGRKVVVEFSRQAFIGLHAPSSDLLKDDFGEVIQFLSTATSAEDVIQKFHELRRAEERRKQLAADEAWRRNPYRNQRASRRL